MEKRRLDGIMDDEPKDLSPDTKVPSETREKWDVDIRKAFKKCSDSLQIIRPRDTLHLDARSKFMLRVSHMLNSMIMLWKNSTVRARTREMTLAFFSRAGEYIRAHPVAFGFQMAAIVVLVISVLGLPILGAAGFTAIGPAAGTAAAAWQSSLVLVQVGTLFAWCQSAAMGGAAVGAIIGAGAAAAGVAGVATAATIPGWKEKIADAFKFAVDAVRGSGEKAKNQEGDSDGKPKL